MSGDERSATTLGWALEHRENNLSTARLTAALIVVLAHCYPIAGRAEPAALGTVLHNPYLGNYAVASFFVLSGFLVTRSVLSGRRSLLRYAAARVLRLYPALACAVAASVALATLFNVNPPGVTLGYEGTWTYAWRNATAWEFVAHIPGAFSPNPLPYGPNGSLWTLPIESRMYVWVGLLGALGALARPLLGVGVLAVAALMIVVEPIEMPDWLLADWQELMALEFIAGMAMYLLRDWIRLSLGFALFLVAMYAVFAQWADAERSSFAFAACLPYWLFVLTCHPALPIVRLPGDYSYGVYLYSFPLQQVLVALWPDMSMAVMMAASCGGALAIGAWSWHRLEAPMLRLKPAA